MLDYPADTPDLNPIDLWAVVKIRDIRPNNVNDLKVAASITPTQYHRWIASMPWHIDAVICSKGGSANYCE